VVKLDRFHCTIIVNIPHVYDMDRNSVTNLEIQAFNRNINKTAKVFSHVAIERWLIDK